MLTFLHASVSDFQESIEKLAFCHGFFFFCSIFLVHSATYALRVCLSHVVFLDNLDNSFSVPASKATYCFEKQSLSL